MSKQSVKTYTIGINPLHSSSYNTYRTEIPTSNNNNQIMVPESIPIEKNTLPCMYVIESKPTDQIVEDSQNDAYQIGINETFIIDQTNHEDSFTTNYSTFTHTLTDDPSSDKDRVRVIIRVRPMNNKEYASDKQPQKVLHCVNENSIVFDGGQHSRRFGFDSVFDEASTQEEVFHYSGVKRLVDMAIDGYIATCFAYGQTGSGKTHTMIGAEGASIFRMDRNYRARNLGVVPRSIDYLFQRLRDKTMETSSPYYIRVSYCEIYNEQIRDLIRPGNPDSLQVRGSVEEGFYVENLYHTYIETIDELLTILEEGELNRAMASHKLNETSSRSHAMLSIQIEQDLPEYNDENEQMTRQGKLVFVDLAGSEKVKQSHSKGKQLVETNNINKSLLTLGTCISALSDPSKRAGHIPYRESKLTRLLADSLGGHGIALMIACISPSRICENESLNTLRYANRAKNIENVPIVKTDSKQNVINRLKLEVRKLKDENYQLKKKLGGQPLNNLPTLKNRNYDSGSQTSIRSSASSDLQNTRGPYNGTQTQKIRTHHEILTRENDKLAKQLSQRDQKQGQPNGRRIIVIEEDEPEEEEAYSPRNRQSSKNNTRIPDEELLELVRRPSYLNRYRTERNKNSSGNSSQQRKTTVVRRAT
ncbi:unnamed protein product [Adineta steineri]|uniref:Kinesin-like protein n=1 Tax=Adineta steineri TaxID=433720 RepID=A0A818Q0V5_9BILA|nr:unnamed protein product [Adineta steineri]CAF3627483.1 unnamed protein product [Adineta steineri]